MKKKKKAFSERLYFHQAFFLSGLNKINKMGITIFVHVNNTSK